MLGALLGWLLTGWVSRRTERWQPPARVSVTVLSVTALLAVAPAMALGVSVTVDSRAIPGWLPMAPWFGLVWPTRLPAVIGALLALIVVAAATLGRPGQPAASRSTAP